MKKKQLLYFPLIVLAIISFTVLFIHFRQLFRIVASTSNEAVLPFSYTGQVPVLTPEAEAAGIRIGDVIVGINGVEIGDNESYRNAIAKFKPDEKVSLTLRRKSNDGQIQIYETSVTTQKVIRNFNYYTRETVGFLFLYILPTFCIVLALWVVFVRAQDFLAWVLVFVLLGMSFFGFESYPSITLVGAYRDFVFSAWSLAMLLFGIYFPERWSVDKKIPWAKWILIIPLAFQILLTILSYFRNFLGIDLFPYIEFLAKPYRIISFFVNFFAFFIFFTALAHKSLTIENSDAKRRLKLMLYGTSIAALPPILIIFYQVFSKAKGSLFDILPFWAAIASLLLAMLFPLTLAYVIVIERAMDVRVVIRQGLQYALATNGIRILQFLLLIGIGLGVFWIINNYGSDFSKQFGIIVGGIALIPLTDWIAKYLRVWIDRKFFREAYNAEQLLSDLSEEVRAMVETKPLLETVSAKISESLHVPQVALLLKNGNSFQPAYALGYEDFPPVELSEEDKTIEKLKKNQPLTIYEDDPESWVNEELETPEREKLHRLNSQLLLPIGAKNRLSGVISLSPKRSEEPYSPNDLRLLKSVATQTGLALENSRLTEAIAYEAAQKERLNTEIEIAREVQERLFPQEMPRVEGLDYYGACRPALGVGGDYYDFLELPDNKFGIAIGDVSGKGIGASLMMASLQASLRGQAIHCRNDLAELMKHVNTLVYEASTSNRYATFFYAQLDIKTRQLIYVNAGHNPPVLLRKNGEILRLEEGGAVVGMLPSMFADYTQGEITLEAGDLLVGSTDGITEAMNPQEEEWSEEAMIEELKIVRENNSEEILNHIVAKADEFADGAKQHDDMTMIIVKILDNNGNFDD